ncbi:MAG: low affinity iron permease family protein [Planctomycetia bacterium]|nr:low affinity iron permease family protein [Planctomycetia bacterium]
MTDFFHRFARAASDCLGSPFAFVAALATVLVWALTGPLFGYSDTWQLVINTGTTIVTFLMVFLIQNAQNRDSLAVNLKLDELLRAVVAARTGLVDLEDQSNQNLSKLKREFATIADSEVAASREPEPPAT